MNWQAILSVAAGGAIGSVLRFGVAQWLRWTHFPLGTFMVNLAGCFLIGCMLGLSLRNPHFEQQWRLFLATGFCGGFTTFSAFSLESIALLQQQRIGLFFLYAGGTLALGLVATWLGYSMLK